VTQTQELRRMFEDHNGWLTLGEIMQTYLGASYRQRLTDLRRELAAEGKTIVCYPNRKDGHKSETSWRVENLPAPASPVTYTESSGQMAFVIR
jgi:hypothetical protein